MSTEIILYDLPAKDGKAWSLNPWKTRMLLQFKNLPFTTQWVEYPDIAPTFKSLSIHPANDTPPYTIPGISINGKPTMDSLAIAKVIEAAHPTPSIHLDDPMFERVRENLGRWANGLRGVWVCQVPLLLNGPSEAYFNRTRSAALGRPLEEIRAEVYAGGEAVDAKWAQVEPALDEAVAMLKENSEGPFFLGKTVSYADFIFVTALHFFKRVNEEKLYKRLVAQRPEFEELYAACAKWMAKED